MHLPRHHRTSAREMVPLASAQGSLAGRRSIPARCGGALREARLDRVSGGGAGRRDRGTRAARRDGLLYGEKGIAIPACRQFDKKAKRYWIFRHPPFATNNVKTIMALLYCTYCTILAVLSRSSSLSESFSICRPLMAYSSITLESIEGLLLLLDSEEGKRCPAI